MKRLRGYPDIRPVIKETRISLPQIQQTTTNKPGGLR